MEGWGMIFAGVKKPYITVLSLEVGRIAPIHRKTLEIAGRPGGIPQGYETGVRPIKAVVEFEAESHTEWLKMFDDMAGWLIREKPASLFFEQEPGRTYMAELEGGLETREINIYGQVTLNFICADTFIYGPEQAYSFNNGAAIVFNTGTAPTSPVYELDVLDDITHVDIFSDEAYIRLGEPAPIHEPVYERQTLLLSDTLKTLTGWSDVTDVDNGYVAGTMSATQSGFTASAFGTEISPRKWQGPSKRRSLPEAVQNFQMIATVDMLNVGKGTGMIEIYLLDALGNTVAKVGIEDIMQSVAENQVKFQLGNVQNRKVQYYRTADYKPAWNDYTGVLRLFRDGNRFRPYFAIVQPDGKHVWVSSAYLYTDVQDEYAAPITQIQIAIRKWPGTTEATMRVRDLKVWRLNDPAEGLPYIAQKDDKIIIDTKESVVLLNGEPRDDLKDFFSDFFDLEPGQTTLLMQPADKVAGKITVTERYL